MKLVRILMVLTMVSMASLIFAQEGEERGAKMKVNDKFDEYRKGVRLILSYDKASSSFKGTVENVTKKMIKKVRVEIHLSNGLELGPTVPVNLKAGKKAEVKLPAEGESFIWWKAHAEAGEGSEHSGENGEHREKRGEHGSKKRSHNEKGEH